MNSRHLKQFDHDGNLLPCICFRKTFMLPTQLFITLLTLEYTTNTVALQIITLSIYFILFHNAYHHVFIYSIFIEHMDKDKLILSFSVNVT